MYPGSSWHRYHAAGLARLFSNDATDQPGDTQREVILYARVSSAAQRAHLDNQVDLLRSSYPNARVIRDIGSGVNFKRKGLQTLLERACQGLVSSVVVLDRDRLARFGADLIEHVLKQHDVTLHVERHDAAQRQPGDPNELADDLLAITTVFVASHHGRRAADNRRRRREARTDEIDDRAQTPG